jgi:hypothetical protein
MSNNSSNLLLDNRTLLIIVNSLLFVVYQFVRGFLGSYITMLSKFNEYLSLYIGVLITEEDPRINISTNITFVVMPGAFVVVIVK